MPRTLRITFYSLTLAFAFFETVLGFLSAYLTGFSPYMLIFGNVAGGLSLVTWIWISVLLLYNNRPGSTHALTKTSIHFYSFLAFVPIWIALGIMILTQSSYECDLTKPSDGEAGGWCGASASAGTLGLLVSILSVVTAIIICKGSTNMSLHVCSGDETYPGAKELLTRTV